MFKEFEARARRYLCPATEMSSLGQTRNIKSSIQKVSSWHSSNPVKVPTVSSGTDCVETLTTYLNSARTI